MMVAECDTKILLRPRARSFKYCISHTRGLSQVQSSRKDLTRSKNKSIINFSKLGQVSSLKKMAFNHNQTMDDTERQHKFKRSSKKDSCLDTFLSFASKDYFRENQQNVDIRASIPDFNHEFDKKASHFTFFDTMSKPIEYIEKVLQESTSEMKGQRYDMAMIRGELNRIRKITERNLEQTSGVVRGKLEEIKRIMSSSKVIEHERKLRSRKEVTLLAKGLSLNRKLCDSLNQRNLQVQNRIFNCYPFQLQVGMCMAIQVSDGEQQQ